MEVRDECAVLDCESVHLSLFNAVSIDCFTCRRFREEKEETVSAEREGSWS